MRKRLHHENRKLYLKKETIADLGIKEMKQINVGSEFVAHNEPVVKVTEGCVSYNPCSTATWYKTCVDCLETVGVNID